jgi:two-component system LytT family sensor kinase
MSTPLTLRQKLMWFGILTAFWVFLALIFGTQMALLGPFTWAQALQFAFRDWYPWMLLSPVVVWVSGRYPLEAGAWKRSVPIHLAACVLVVSACAGLWQLCDPGPGRGEGRPPPWMQKPPGPDRPPQEGGHHRDGMSENHPPGSPGSLGPPPGGPGHFRGRPGPGPMFFARANFNIPIYFFVVSMSHAFTYFRRSRERERQALELQARLAQAKMQALRMELHPHFLFNTLNAISTLVHKDPAAADEMIVNLSELLRQTLEDSDQQEVPLRKELDFLDRYLEIQLVRFGDRLRVEKQVDPAVLAAQVPTMILQPLVENAIRHGIEPQASAGIVSIVASRVGAYLELSVGDTGNGTKLQTEKPNREGIGLANTRARLQQLYGTNGRLKLERRPSGGFIAQLEIPYHEQPLPNSPTAT